MSNVFYGAWLVRRGNLGWATHVAWFPQLPILAHIQLSSVHLQAGERFQSFRNEYALAYIETVNTPPGLWGFPMPNKETDNNVWLTTDHVTFQLQADGPVTCSAFGLIHDRSSSSGNSMDIRESVEFAVFTDDGVVVGTHREVRLDGTDGLRLDDIQERVLTRAAAESDQKLDIVPVDLDRLPPGAEFRIHPRTRRPIPPPTR